MKLPILFHAKIQDLKPIQTAACVFMKEADDGSLMEGKQERAKHFLLLKHKKLRQRSTKL